MQGKYLKNANRGVFLIFFAVEMYFFSPPLSAEGGPDKEEDAANEWTDGILRQADGVEK